MLSLPTIGIFHACHRSEYCRRLLDLVVVRDCENWRFLCRTATEISPRVSRVRGAQSIRPPRKLFGRHSPGNTRGSLAARLRDAIARTQKYLTTHAYACIVAPKVVRGNRIRFRNYRATTVRIYKQERSS